MEEHLFALSFGTKRNDVCVEWEKKEEEQVEGGGLMKMLNE